MPSSTLLAFAKSFGTAVGVSQDARSHVPIRRRKILTDFTQARPAVAVPAQQHGSQITCRAVPMQS
jgi:hypothetical protein